MLEDFNWGERLILQQLINRNLSTKSTSSKKTKTKGVILVLRKKTKREQPISMISWLTPLASGPKF